MDTEEIKQSLLKEAAEKPVRLFKQFDVFQRLGSGDDIIKPDQDGDCLFSSGGYELNRTNELRVMVPENRTAEEVIRGLKKVIAWIEEDPSVVGHAQESELYEMAAAQVLADALEAPEEFPF